MTEIVEAKEVTQKELSSATGLTPSNLSHIQNNNRSPSVESLVKIANALHCRTDVLLNR